MTHIIKELEKGCILEQMGVKTGDAVLEINGRKIIDVFDYRFLSADEFVEVLIKKENGEEWLLEIEKDEDEDLGASFSEAMMDKPRACVNNCIFCFIDQLPRGMRDTLYFKDDDTRLSFLIGNYVTLTNITNEELDRFIYYRLSPINVSVHTTDPELRVKMLRNKNAWKILKQLHRISNAGIEINCQIVLVNGVNDGENLNNTVRDLLAVEGVRSVSVVPVGLTAFRDKLTALDEFNKENSLGALEIIHSWQKKALKIRGVNFVYAADEFYFKAGVPLPSCKSYDGFPQIENGVGMTALFIREFADQLRKIQTDGKKRKAAVVTGKLSGTIIKKLVKKFTGKFTNTEIKVIMVENSFFGASITVSGLLTGRDILAALKKENIIGRVLLPTSCLKDGTQIFLDDLSVSELNYDGKTRIVPVKVDGGEFVTALLEAIV